MVHNRLTVNSLQIMTTRPRKMLDEWLVLGGLWSKSVTNKYIVDNDWIGAGTNALFHIALQV